MANQEMTEIWTCPICQTSENYPMSCSCGHSFCELCLLNILVVGKVHNCPLCQKNIENFAPNYELGKLLNKEYKIPIPPTVKKPQPVQQVNQLEAAHPQVIDWTRNKRKRSLYYISNTIIDILLLSLLIWVMVQYWYFPAVANQLVSTTCNITNCTTNIVNCTDINNNVYNCTNISVVYSFDNVYNSYSLTQSDVDRTYCNVTTTIACYYNAADIANSLNIDETTVSYNLPIHDAFALIFLMFTISIFAFVIIIIIIATLSYRIFNFSCR